MGVVVVEQPAPFRTVFIRLFNPEMLNVCSEAAGHSRLQEPEDVWWLQTRLDAGGGTERQRQQCSQRRIDREASVCYGCVQGFARSLLFHDTFQESFLPALTLLCHWVGPQVREITLLLSSYINSGQQQKAAAHHLSAPALMVVQPVHLKSKEMRSKSPSALGRPSKTPALL